MDSGRNFGISSGMGLSLVLGARLQSSLNVCFLCLPAHAGQYKLSDWKLYWGLVFEDASIMMSRTGWLDVLTDNGARFIPNKGHVMNSTFGACSMFTRRSLICSTEKRMGTFPLSRISTPVVIQPEDDWGFRKWMISLSLTLACSPLAKLNLLVVDYALNQMFFEFSCDLQALIRRSTAKRNPMARAQPESRMTNVGLRCMSTYSQRSDCSTPCP